MNTKKTIVVGAIFALALTLIFSASPGLAQVELRDPYPVRGYVYNSTGSPVPAGVLVSITDITKEVTNTTTDELGFYYREIYAAIPTSEDDDLFTCSATHGYESGSCSFILNRTANISQPCHIYLQADTTPPEITSLQPPHGSTTTDTTPTISASYNDPESEIDTLSVVLKLDGTDVTTAAVTPSGVTYTPTTALSYATHTVNLEVSNNADRTALKEWTFTITALEEEEERRRVGGGGAAPRPPEMNVPVDPETGEVTSTTMLTVDGATLTFPKGTIIKDAGGNPLATSITMLYAPTIAESVGAIAVYDFGPAGLTFEPPIDLVIPYDPADIPAGMSESDLMVRMWDGTAWIDFVTSIDTVAHVATAKVSHFSIFGLFAAAPVAAPPVTPTPTVMPTATPEVTPTPTPPIPPIRMAIVIVVVVVAIVAAAIIVAVAFVPWMRRRKKS